MSKRDLLQLVLLPGMLSLTTSAQQPPAPSVVVLTRVTVIDGTGAPPQANATLVIENDRITQLYRTGERPPPPGASVHDLPGHYVIPGLIDAHVHLGAGMLPNGTLGRLLRGGVTTARNMVGNCDVLRDLNRRAVTGEIESPEIYYSATFGGPIMAGDPRGRRPAGTGPGAGSPCGRLLADPLDPVELVSTSQAAGATGIKLYADITADAAKPIAAEAHRQGLVVWAHAALFPARPSELVQAGADVLSHAAYLIWETVDSLPTYRRRVSGAPFTRVEPADPKVERVLRLMAARGTILDATLHLFHAQATNPEPSPNEDFQVPREQLAAAAKWADAVTRRARELGVLVSAGTDGQGARTEGSLPNLHTELELLVKEAGFSPLEAIRAATSVAARTMRLEDSLGTIAVGKRADLVVLRSDPTADIRNTRDIAFVIKRGRVIGEPR